LRRVVRQTNERAFPDREGVPPDRGLVAETAAAGRTLTHGREDRRPLAIALMGPTASGKTDLAVEWVHRHSCAIVSVDSALVYRGLDIGAAKPDAALLATAPHRLIDIREPTQAYSAAEFAHDALAAMRDITAGGHVPLLVGGTGLYFRALLDGLAPMPPAIPELRAEIEAEAGRIGWAALHSQLQAVDPHAAARIGPADAQRIQRALEVYRGSGVAVSDWQAAARGAPPFPYRVLRLALVPRDRAILHMRIAQRFRAMLEQGLLEEVCCLRALPGINADLPSMRAVGYRQAWRHLDGVTGFNAFVDEGIAATRQLAKRQLTWLRGQRDVRWLDPCQGRQELDLAVQAFLG
jgi:tRNA dimethylallyltransferase